MDIRINYVMAIMRDLTSSRWPAPLLSIQMDRTATPLASNPKSLILNSQFPQLFS
jgi:hypothetical protein